MDVKSVSFKLALGALALLLLALSFVVGVGILLRYATHDTNAGSAECPVEKEKRIVRGSSLEGILSDGETVTILFGHYDCTSVVRDDVVVYAFAGRENPVIKIVKGIPGDAFQLVSADEITGIDDSWNILLNGEVLLNFEGEPYLVGGKGYRILRLYEESYNGVIPDRAHLLLGSGPWGSLDSSEFGLIDKSDLIGKVIYK